MAPTTTVYQVTGMSCGHCVNAVTEEVRSVEGVQDVRIDLPSGRVTVTSDRALARDQIASAVDEAGYTLA